MTNFTQSSLIESISECCDKNRLSYGNLSPTQMSPGVWEFSAVPMDDECSKHGHCRQQRYYVKEVDNKMVLC